MLLVLAGCGRVAFDATGGTGDAGDAACSIPLTGVLRASASWWTTCAVMADHTARCWGSNAQGQLGDGTTTDSAVPVGVANLTGVVDIAVESDHACAVLTTGEAWCWGDNSNGQLGDDSNVPS